MKRKTTSLLLTGILASAIPVSGSVVVAGWDNFTHNTADTFDANIVNGVTAQVIGTSSGGIGWGNWDNADGASIDGTWGTVTGDVSPSTTALADGSSSVGLRNATTSGELTFTLINTSGSTLDFTSFHFDGSEMNTKAAGNWTFSILAGSAITVTEVSSGTLSVARPMPTGGFDIDLTALGDRSFDDGETVTFELAFTGGTGDGSGGHNTMIDNIAFIAVPEPSTYALFAGFLALAVIIRRRIRA